MDKIRKIFILLYGLAIGMQVQAQDKIVNPDISYAGTPRTLTIGGINVSGVEGYEDYVLTGISGLSVGEQVEVPGDDITNAVNAIGSMACSLRWLWLPTLLWVINSICTSICRYVHVSPISTISV